MTTLVQRLLCAALPLAVLAACGDRTPAPGSQPPPTGAPPANTASPATSTPSTPTTPSGSSSSEPVVAPGTATDVDAKKGTETGMVGGASGDVASGGKPGSGTDAGAGTGAAVSSGDRIGTKK